MTQGPRRKPPSNLLDPSYFFADQTTPAAERAWVALSMALNGRTECEEQQIIPGRLEDLLGRWPSTIPQIEEAAGGFYGVSVIAGERGIGKTRLALSSAVEAAATQRWQVVYLSAELDSFEVAMRLGRIFDAYPSTLDSQDFLHVVHVGRGQEFDDLRVQIEAATDPAGDPILVVLDSINTVAELMGGGYLETLGELGMWAMLSRRMSMGAVSWLLVSETNKQGGVKGGKLDYWADCIVRMRLPKGAHGAAPGSAPISMTWAKSRRTGGEGPLGLFIRDAGERLVPAETRPKLRVVGGRDDDGDLSLF